MHRRSNETPEEESIRITAYALVRCRAGASELDRILARARLGARLSVAFVDGLSRPQPTPALVKWRSLPGR